MQAKEQEIDRLKKSIAKKAEALTAVKKAAALASTQAGLASDLLLVEDSQQVIKPPIGAPQPSLVDILEGRAEKPMRVVQDTYDTGSQTPRPVNHYAENSLDDLMDVNFDDFIHASQTDDISAQSRAESDALATTSLVVYVPDTQRSVPDQALSRPNDPTDVAPQQKDARSIRFSQQSPTREEFGHPTTHTTQSAVKSNATPIKANVAAPREKKRSTATAGLDATVDYTGPPHKRALRTSTTSGSRSASLAAESTTDESQAALSHTLTGSKAATPSLGGRGQKLSRTKVKRGKSHHPKPHPPLMYSMPYRRQSAKTVPAGVVLIE